MFTKSDVETYFMGEKQASLLFMIVGVTAIILGLLLLFYLSHPAATGAARPVLLIGILQLVVGYRVYSRSDAQRKNIVYKMDMNPQALEQEELPRMQKVMNNFVALKYFEIALALAGTGLWIYYRNEPYKQWWMGLGLGLTIQAVLMLTADYFAEQRGHKYHKGLESYLQQTP